ncbi:hypothetical protein ACFWFF_38395 [Streptomyces sp. NPDC060223]
MAAGPASASGTARESEAYSKGARKSRTGKARFTMRVSPIHP